MYLTEVVVTILLGFNLTFILKELILALSRW